MANVYWEEGQGVWLKAVREVGRKPNDSWEGGARGLANKRDKGCG